jgi:hypothetical protein
VPVLSIVYSLFRLSDCQLLIVTDDTCCLCDHLDRLCNLILLWATFPQILEIVRLEGQALTHDEGLLSRDIHLLQVMIFLF